MLLILQLYFFQKIPSPTLMLMTIKILRIIVLSVVQFFFCFKTKNKAKLQKREDELYDAKMQDAKKDACHVAVILEPKHSF